MLKNQVLLAFFLLLPIIVHAQDQKPLGIIFDGESGQKAYYNDSTKRKLLNKDATVISKPARDFLVLALTYNNWVNKPDSVKTKSFNWGFNGAICYDFPIKKSKFSFATGLGVNVAIVYLDQLQLSLNDTGNAVAHFRPDTAHFGSYDYLTTYLMAPFEIRYFSNTHNRNKGFKAALGLQIGFLLGAHTKADASVSGNDVSYNTSTARYLNTWTFTSTLRVGLGNFALFGSYNLTTLFKENQGPPITPISFGICVTGL